jgi:RNA polymerase sigma factor (sigma-70 family)
MPNWAALYAQHRDAMIRVAARALQVARQDTDGAQDIVNTVFAEVMEKPPIDVRNWEAFLVRATVRRAQDLLGSAGVRKSTAVGLGSDEDSQCLERDAGINVEEEALLRLQWDSVREPVRKVLAGLPDDQREVVRWRLFEEMSNVEISPRLGVTPQRVSQLWKAGWSAITTAVRNDPTLRSIWSDDEGDTGD